MSREIQDIFTECDEVAEALNRWPAKENQIITLDEARFYILTTNPSWKDGGETMQVIDNVAMAFRDEHNAEVEEKRRMQLRTSLLKARSIKEIPPAVRDALDSYSLDLKQILRMDPKEMFKYYYSMYGKNATAEQLYDIVVKLAEMKGR